MPEMLMITVNCGLMVRQIRNKLNSGVCRYYPLHLTLITYLADYLSFTGNKPNRVFTSASGLWDGRRKGERTKSGAEIMTSQDGCRCEL